MTRIKSERESLFPVDFIIVLFSSVIYQTFFYLSELNRVNCILSCKSYTVDLNISQWSFTQSTR